MVNKRENPHLKNIKHRKSKLESLSNICVYVYVCVRMSVSVGAYVCAWVYVCLVITSLHQEMK